MDDHRLFVRVVVENNDLKQAPGTVGTDDEGSPVAADESDRVADCVGDVFVRDSVLAGAVRDFHVTR